MTFTRTLTATLFLASATAASANGYDADALLFLQNAETTQVAENPIEKLKAAAEANPNLEWHDGEGHEADSMVMLSDVLFDFGAATLDPDAITTLSSIAKDLKDVAGIEIAGHTDNVGSEDDNLALAQARAETVRSWLIENAGLQEGQLISVSMGETQPIAPNVLADGADNPEGRSKNRRVEFHILEEDTEKTAAVKVTKITSSAI